MWKQKVRLHTDEYEISLSRELQVCRSTIKRIRQTLELFEKKHNRTSEAFLEEVRTGKMKNDPDLREDGDAWQTSLESLRKWEELEKQYIEMFNAMKI